MLKKLFVMLFTMFIFIPFVQADTVNISSTNIVQICANNNSNINDDTSNCEGIIGDWKTDKNSFAYYLHITFQFLKYVVPIIIVALSTVDYIKAFASSDGDSVKKANKNMIIRLVFALLFYFLPIIIELLLSVFHITGNCDIA